MLLIRASGPPPTSGSHFVQVEHNCPSAERQKGCQRADTATLRSLLEPHTAPGLDLEGTRRGIATGQRTPPSPDLDLGRESCEIDDNKCPVVAVAPPFHHEGRALTRPYPLRRFGMKRSAGSAPVEHLSQASPDRPGDPLAGHGHLQELIRRRETGSIEIPGDTGLRGTFLGVR